MIILHRPTAKGLVMVLAKEKSEGVNEAFIRIKLRPGSGGNDGEAEVETKSPSGYANGTKWYVATGFSNNKKINRINVTIKKDGEGLQFFIDKNRIAEYIKGIPADMSFNALSFDMASSSGENDKYFISNKKIRKIDDSRQTIHEWIIPVQVLITLPFTQNFPDIRAA